MPRLNLDILYEIVEQVARFDPKNSRPILLSLALVCRTVNDSIRPILFSSVHWPHPDKHDDTGLLFFPDPLLPYFRTFHLDWPDHWPDTTPPRWGTRPLSTYQPKHLDKLEDALSRMRNIHTFQITCPFDPPTKFLHNLVLCSNIKDLKLTDTPLCTLILPSLPPDFNLERMTLVSVGEPVRVGEGPYNRRYQDIGYFRRSYRKRYFEANEGFNHPGIISYAARQFFTALCRTQHLQQLQISASFLWVDELRSPQIDSWPCLRTLILSGPTPSAFFDLPTLISKMPKLTDLRVLLSTTKSSDTRGGAVDRVQFSMIPAPNSHYTADPGTPNAYSRLTSLAMSNAYNTKGVLRYTTSLVRLAICAIISPPWMPIALRKTGVEGLLDELEDGGGNESLKQIRLIQEDELDASIFFRLGKMCPKLEIVEVERCGYQDSAVQSDWAVYADAFSTYHNLQELRIAMPFLGCDQLQHEHSQLDNNNPTCTREFRTPCASYLASRIPSLLRIGFEYRARPAQRYEDRWLDFDIVRLRNGEVRLVELRTSWYPFPEIWEPTTLPE